MEKNFKPNTTKLISVQQLRWNILLFRYHKNKKYCWEEDNECGVGEPSSQILSTDQGSWIQGWYCFLVDKNKDKLEVKRCPQATHRYICETGRLEMTDRSVYVTKIDALHYGRQIVMFNWAQNSMFSLLTLSSGKPNNIIYF